MLCSAVVVSDAIAMTDCVVGVIVMIWVSTHDVVSVMTHIISYMFTISCMIVVDNVVMYVTDEVALVDCSVLSTMVFVMLACGDTVLCVVGVVGYWDGCDEVNDVDVVWSGVC